MMAIEINGIITWLSGWFPLKGTETRNLSTIVSAINTALDNKLNTNQNDANKNMVTNGSGVIVTQSIDSSPTQNSDNMVKSGGVHSALSNKIDTAGSGLTKQGTTLKHSNSVSAQSSKAIYKVKHDDTGHISESSAVDTSDLPNSQAYNHIKAGESTTLTMTNQKLINDGINAQFQSMSNLIEELASKQYVVVDTIYQEGNTIEYRPSTTPSEATMGAIYLVKMNDDPHVLTTYTDTYMEYITVRSGTEGNYTYYWEKIGNIELNLNGYVTTTNFYNHTHGQINNGGTITSSPATMDSLPVVYNATTNSQDSILFIDASDSNKIKRTHYVGARYVSDPSAYANLGTSQNANQNTINTAINNAIGGKQATITSIAKLDRDNGTLIFYTGDEPSNS